MNGYVTQTRPLIDLSEVRLMGAPTKEARFRDRNGRSGRSHRAVQLSPIRA